ncbi:MAG: DNA damage-inducible protein D [bacterium]
MDIVSQVQTSLDQIKRLTSKGIEYWMARDLMAPLGYTKWDNFERVIERAKMACESLGSDPSNQFLDVGKKVSIGSGAERSRRDYVVSRYGAYLIAMNGSPKLPQVAAAQSYFAIQTRKQEILESQVEAVKRIELRERVKDANKHLGDAAKDSGVLRWGLFQDAGYRGLYGMSLKEVKGYKGLSKADNLLDRSGRAELAANEFRITQTEQALRHENVAGDIGARETHKKVGRTVRETISKLGGTMPEDLPPEPSIKKLEAKQKKEITEKSELPAEDSN